MRCLSKIIRGKVRHVNKKGEGCTRSKHTIRRHNRMYKSSKSGVYSRKKHMRRVYRTASNRAQQMRAMRAARMGGMVA